MPYNFVVSNFGEIDVKCYTISICFKFLSLLFDNVLITHEFKHDIDTLRSKLDGCQRMKRLFQKETLQVSHGD